MRKQLLIKGNKNFRSRRWRSSLLGLRTQDPLLSPPSTWAEIFYRTCSAESFFFSPHFPVQIGCLLSDWLMTSKQASSLTCAPENFRSCWWGAERRVLRAQTQEQGSPSAWAELKNVLPTKCFFFTKHPITQLCHGVKFKVAPYL